MMKGPRAAPLSTRIVPLTPASLNATRCSGVSTMPGGGPLIVDINWMNVDVQLFSMESVRSVKDGGR